jgi:hypothetical protein
MPQEVERMTMYPWFVEAVPDKSYNLMAVDRPAPPLSRAEHAPDDIWSTGNLGEGMIIGILDASAEVGWVLLNNSKDEGMATPPAKWKGGYDHREACNNRVIGMRSFVEKNRSKGTDMSSRTSGLMRQPVSDAGYFVQRASALGIDYATAFTSASKVHLAIYCMCDEQEC